MFSVFASLGNGEFIFVASRDELGQATQLVRELKASWPREYAIRDLDGKDIDANVYPEIHPKLVTPEDPSRSAR
jgi:hypothetical protein